MSRLLLAIVLLVDLVLFVWCANTDGVSLDGPSEAVLQLPVVLYAGWLALVSREPRRRLPAAALALVAVPLHYAAIEVVEALSTGPYLDPASPLLLVETLLVSPVLAAAWGVALLDGPWQRGLLAVPAVVLVQMALARASAVDQTGAGTGPLSWSWQVLPLLFGVLACSWAARRPRVTPPAS